MTSKGPAIRLGGNFAERRLWHFLNKILGYSHKVCIKHRATESRLTFISFKLKIKRKHAGLNKIKASWFKFAFAFHITNFPVDTNCSPSFTAPTHKWHGSYTKEAMCSVISFPPSLYIYHSVTIFVKKATTSLWKTRGKELHVDEYLHLCSLPGNKLVIGKFERRIWLFVLWCLSRYLWVRSV